MTEFQSIEAAAGRRRGHAPPRRRASDHAPSRRRRAVWLAAATFAMVSLPAVLLVTIRVNDEHRRIEQHAEELVERAAASTRRLVMMSEQALASVAFLARNGCDEALISAFRFANAGDTPLRNLGYVDTAGLLRCTSMGVVDPPRPVEDVELLGAEGQGLLFSPPVDTVYDPGKSIVVYHPLRNGGYVNVLISARDLLGYVTPFEMDAGHHVTASMLGEELTSLGARPAGEEVTGASRDLGLYGLSIESRIDRSVALSGVLREGAMVAGFALVLGLGLAGAVYRLAARRTALIDDLDRALARDELSLVYQPIVMLPDGRTSGFEALTRWRHAEEGWIPPDVFIPLAERAGRIQALTDWVFDRSLADLGPMLRADRDLHLAINIAPEWLGEPDNLPALLARLKAADVDPGQITLEVTERALADTENCKRTVAALAENGVALAVDDFGTGYSSLAYIANFDLHYLKIDRSFVAALNSGAPSAVLVETIQAMAERMGLATVAEGVEEAEQVEALRALGVRLAQGWHFARPMPPEAVPGYLGRASESLEPAPA